MDCLNFQFILFLSQKEKKKIEAFFSVAILHTGLGTMKPANKFHKPKKKDDTMPAVWKFGVSATTIIPYNVK